MEVDCNWPIVQRLPSSFGGGLLSEPAFGASLLNLCSNYCRLSYLKLRVGREGEGEGEGEGGGRQK